MFWHLVFKNNDGCVLQIAEFNFSVLQFYSLNFWKYFLQDTKLLDFFFHVKRSAQKTALYRCMYSHWFRASCSSDTRLCARWWHFRVSDRNKLHRHISWTYMKVRLIKQNLQSWLWKFEKIILFFFKFMRIPEKKTFAFLPNNIHIRIATTPRALKILTKI